MLIVPASDNGLVGYVEGNETYICCDRKALAKKRCSFPNRLIFNGNKTDSFLYKQVSFVYILPTG